MVDCCGAPRCRYGLAALVLSGLVDKSTSVAANPRAATIEKLARDGGTSELLGWAPLTPEQALEHLKVKKSTLEKRRIEGRGPAYHKPRSVIDYNGSSSLPIGLYRVTPIDSLRRGDLVVVPVPETHETLTLERRYLGTEVPLIKRVTALQGDRISVLDGTVLIKEVRLRAP